MNVLFPFQHESVQFLKERKYALLALEQGLGKTIVAIAAAKALREEKMLVVCPASVKYNWEREIKAWDQAASVYIINGSTWKSVPAKYTIINYDLIHKPGIAKHLLKMQFDILILDEAHFLKSSRAKRTRTVYSHNGLADNAVRVWLMTGTPVLNRPVEIFPMLRRFMPERLGKYADYMAFTKRFCAAYQGKWGWDDTGASHLEELASYLDGFMLRRLKKDVMKDLPDKIFQKIVFDAPTAAVKTLVKKERELYREDMLGAFSTLRQDVGLAKLPMVVEHLENLLEETDKVIIFAHHRKVLEGLKHRLKDHNPVLLYGGLTAQQKQRVIDDFVTDKNKRVFLGQIDAAGIGIDGLQKVANTVVFAEISWVPGQIKQAIDRCHRIGQVNKVLVQFLMMKGGIDEQIYDSLGEKTRVIKKVVESSITHIEEDAEMAKHTLEDNIERIADALESLTAQRTTATVGAMTTDVKETIEAPKAKTPKPVKAAPAAPEMDTQALLAYSNKKVLAIMDPEVRKSTVQSIVARLKTECGTTNIKSLTIEQVPAAKAIVDEVFKTLEDEASLV
jgi:SWI/SNF-related matrix-associated actin-dependent regulator 1 of chromatin subfamily A